MIFNLIDLLIVTLYIINSIKILARYIDTPY